MQELLSMLRERGAALIGFADLAALPADVRCDLPRGISVAVALAPQIVAAIPDGPSQAYADEYDRKNELLDEIAVETAKFLRAQGHQAQELDRLHATYDDATLATRLPYKTVATRAGLGWVGKCALLITEEFGAAIRWTAVLTDAELPVGGAVDESRCGGCTACVDVCPGQACSGANWRAGMPREELFDPFACREAQRKRLEGTGLARMGCGLCIAVCPYTQRHLERHGF
ncbi:MAG: 4Fe-4S double cluster binding domain-containing protein [Planctomycetota bacterium]|jgi:epoxyqueuosine reductase QueG